jgi:hypothetical protein
MSIVRWKVVDKNRNSLIVNSSRKYNLKYEKNKIVKARSDSFGIFCFKTREQALNFCGYKSKTDFITYCSSTFKLIRIKPLCKAKTPKFCLPYWYLNDSYKKYNLDPEKYNMPGNLHTGTICYQKVKVLD